MISKNDEYYVRVMNLRYKIRESKISLLTLSYGLGLRVEIISDVLFFRAPQDEELITKIENLLEKNSLDSTKKYLDGLETLGKRIRFIRDRLSLSQEEFGKLLSPTCSSIFINSVEKDVTLPSIDCVIQISENSGVSLDWLLRGRGPRYYGK